MQTRYPLNKIRWPIAVFVSIIGAIFLLCGIVHYYYIYAEQSFRDYVCQTYLGKMVKVEFDPGFDAKNVVIVDATDILSVMKWLERAKIVRWYDLDYAYFRYPRRNLRIHLRSGAVDDLSISDTGDREANVGYATVSWQGNVYCGSPEPFHDIARRDKH